MKYLYLPILFTLAFGYSKYFESQRKDSEIANIQSNNSKSRSPASIKKDNEKFDFKKWLKKF